MISVIGFNCELGCDLFWFKEMRESFPPHFHESWLFGYMLSGSSEIRLESTARVLNKGDLLLLKPFAAHQCKVIGSAPVEWICLHLRNEYIKKMGMPDKFANLPATIMHRPDLYALWRNLANHLCAANATNCAVFLQNLLTAIIQAVVPNQGMRNELQHKECLNGEIESLCAFLRDNLHQQINLESMAEKCGIKSFKLLRLFRRCKGITPYRYLENLRLIQAQKLMQANKELADCAQACGFYDQSHLNRSFKANLGVTPGAFRHAIMAGQRQ